MGIFKKIEKIFKKVRKKKSKISKIEKTVKKIFKKFFIFFIVGMLPFPGISEKSGNLYGYSLIKSVFKPKSKEPQPEGKKTDNEAGNSDYDSLSRKIKEQLKDVYENPSSEEALKHMVWIEVPVWRLKDGRKVPDREKIQVLDLLADEVKEIFEEIYRGKEKFPIKYLNGYSWRGSLKSLHSTGRAIDINPEENPQVTSAGKVLVGKKWEPGENPYSIKPDGDVVKAFTKRGWTWGADFKTKDYMHFGFDEM